MCLHTYYMHALYAYSGLSLGMYGCTYVRGCFRVYCVKSSLFQWWSSLHVYIHIYIYIFISRYGFSRCVHYIYPGLYDIIYTYTNDLSYDESIYIYIYIYMYVYIVLSVLAQQLRSIQISISQQQTLITFPGDDLLVLRPHSAFFITLAHTQPYSGNSNSQILAGKHHTNLLPPNLKSLFRSVAIMKPNSLIITEAILRSRGFNVKSLAGRLVTTVYLK